MATGRMRVVGENNFHQKPKRVELAIIVDDNSKNGLESGNVNLPLALTRQQVEVFELLRGLSTEREKFHEWYRGAIQVLSSPSPDRIPQAAHSIRELCDKLPDRISAMLRRGKRDPGLLSFAFIRLRCATARQVGFARISGIRVTLFTAWVCKIRAALFICRQRKPG